MDSKPTALERAFQLAKSGRAGSLDDVRAQLKSEGYDLGQLVGPQLIKQLRKLIEAARTPPQS
jgi:hypothetical protein